MELNGYRFVLLYPHPPPADRIVSYRSAQEHVDDTNTTALPRAHTVVVRAGAVVPAVPGGPGRPPGGAGGGADGVVQFSAGGGLVVVRFGVSAVRGHHGEECCNQCNSLEGDHHGGHRSISA